MSRTQRRGIDLFDDPPWKAREATPDQQNPPAFVASAAIAMVMSVTVLVIVFTGFGLMAWELAHIFNG